MSIQDEIKAAGKCGRCDGTGFLDEFKHVHNGVCFRCWGTGCKVTVTEDRHKLTKGDLFGINGILFHVTDIVWEEKRGNDGIFNDGLSLLGNQKIIMVRVSNNKRFSMPRIAIADTGFAIKVTEEMKGKSIFEE